MNFTSRPLTVVLALGITAGAQLPNSGTVTVRHVLNASMYGRHGGLAVVLETARPLILGTPIVSSVPDGISRATVWSRVKTRRVNVGGRKMKARGPGQIPLDITMRSDHDFPSGQGTLDLSLPFDVVDTSGALDHRVLLFQVRTDSFAMPPRKPIRATDILLIPLRILQGLAGIFISCPLDGHCSS